MAEQKQKPTQEEIDKALAFMEATKASRKKLAERHKNDPEYKAKAAAAGLRRRVATTLLCKKAQEKGITVSNAEIEAEMKKLAKA